MLTTSSLVTEHRWCWTRHTRKPLPVASAIKMSLFLKSAGADGQGCKSSCVEYEIKELFRADEAAATNTGMAALQLWMASGLSLMRVAACSKKAMLLASAPANFQGTNPETSLW